MATRWREEDEEFKIGGMTGGMKTKPRFSFHEIRMLLHAVRKNRFVLLKKFNRGVSAEAKKQTWALITAEINGLGENQREVRQIMKKWADLKCDGKRRITAMRGPNGNNLRKKKMGPVERMVHKILMLTPETESISDQDLDEDEDLTKYTTPPSATHFSYLSMSDTSRSFDVSPTSTPDKDLGEPLQSSSDLDAPDEEEPIFENDSASSSYPAPLPPPQSAPLPPPQSAVPLDFTQLKVKQVHTYSRSNQKQNQKQNQNASKAVASTSSSFPPDAPSTAAPPPPPPTPPPTVANGTSSPPAPVAPSPAAKAPSSVCPPPLFSSLPVGVPQRQEQVSALAAQSLRQQAAGRVLLSSVSQSLEALAQSVQLLVESQQELVQEALLLQRETVEVLRDFSNTALSILRDKAGAGQPHAMQRF